MLGKLFADRDASPRLCLVSEVILFDSAYSCHFGHFGFQLLIPLSKLADLTEIVLDSAIEVFRLRVLRAQLALQFGSDTFNFECFLLDGDIRGRFEFLDSDD